MSGLVHRREQQLERMVIVESRRDPHIVRSYGRRERVGRFILPTAVPVEPERRDHLGREREHLPLIVVVRQKRRRLNGMLLNRAHELDLTRAEHVENFLNLRRQNPWLVRIDERIVRMRKWLKER